MTVSGLGGLVGASQDSENRLRGALIGAGFGVAGNKIIGTLAKSHINSVTNSLQKAMPDLAKGNPKLFEQIVDRELKGGEYLKPNNPNMKKGVIASENANISPTTKANLATAKELEASGASELEIWEKTGWFFDDLDKKWKFEINPSGGEFNIDILRDGSSHNLSEVLDDKELFEAYPSLKEIKVYSNSRLGENHNGYYEPDTKTIGLNPKNDLQKTREVLYHEIQHAIQEVEQFDNGYVPARKFILVEAKKAQQNGDFKLAEKLKAHKGQDRYYTYFRTAGEAEARNVANRLDKTYRQSFLGRERHPFETLDVSRDELVGLTNVKQGHKIAYGQINKNDNSIFNTQDREITTSIKVMQIEKGHNVRLDSDEVYNVVSRWKQGGNTNNKLLVGKIDDTEAEILNKEFNFKGKKPLVREIREQNIAHALKQHGDEAIESQRGQIAINLQDISKYQDYIKNSDLRVVQDNNRILYGKQINGHYVVIEEVLEGQDKIIFFDMWKGKGKLNKQVLTQHQRPKHEPLAEQGSAMLANTNLPQQSKLVNNPQNIAERPLLAEQNEAIQRQNKIREIYETQNAINTAKANLGKDYLNDINAVENGYISADGFKMIIFSFFTLF